MLRVAIDLTPTVVSVGGVARYAGSLYRRLAMRDDIVMRPFSVGFGNPAPGRRLPVPVRVAHSAWRNLGWPRAELITGDVDVVHSIDLVPPPTRRPLVVTVHDVLPITHPDLFPPRSVRAAEAQLAGCDRAEVVVTTCAAAASAIAGVGGPADERVVIAPPGWDALPSPPPGEGARSHLLVVGAVTPRKGLEVLAAAVSALGPTCPAVVVVGPDWWDADGVRERVRAADKFGRIRLVGPRNDAALARYYRDAIALCFPTLAEGFGIPCLEAMGLGVPVVASDIPSVRELTAGVARLVPAGDVDAWAAAIDGVLEDGVDPAHIASGRARVAGFVWERTAELLVGAYHRAVA